MATTATLTPAAPTADLDTTAGSLYVYSETGNRGGASMLYEVNGATNTAEFDAVDCSPGAKEFRAPGTKLRITARAASSATSIKTEITEAG